MIEGRDVSSHQGDYQLEQDLDFIFIKATEDRTYVNLNMRAVAARSYEAGLVVGYYHFLHPKNAKEQALHFVTTAGAQPGDLLALDWESTVDGQASVSDVMVFMTEVKRLAPHNKVGLYTTISNWLNTSVKAFDFLWIADPSKAAGKTTVKNWTFHQYSWKPLDKNVARFSNRDELREWAIAPPSSVIVQPPKPYVFEETETSKYGPYGWWQGQRVNRRTYEAVTRAAQMVAWGEVKLSQGGLSGSVTASAKTHLGLDCGDIMVAGHTKAQVWKLADALMQCGAFPFPRGYVADSFQNMKHIHFGMVAADHTHQQMKDQYEDYKAGKDGLYYHRAYTGPKRRPLTTWEHSPQNLAVNGPQWVFVDPAKVETGLYGIKTKGVLVDMLPSGSEFYAKGVEWKKISRDGLEHKYAVTDSGVFYNFSYLQKGKVSA